MRQIDIPGGKAMLRDPATLQVRQRRLVRRAVFDASTVMGRIPENFLQLSEEEKEKFVTGLDIKGSDADKMDAIQDAAILALLESWTLASPVPRTLEAIEELPGDVYDALAEATREMGSALIQTNFAPTPRPDDSPTGGSGGSGIS